MVDNTIQMPTGFGGLMRFDEEYTSRIMIKPASVIVFLVLIIVFRIALSFFLKVPAS